MLWATPNVTLSLQAIAADGLGTYFGQAKIYDFNGLLVTSVSLFHIMDGIYSNGYTPTTEGIYTIIYRLFTDPGLTIPANFERAVETLDVNSIRTNITRLLGLVHDNAVVDNQTYNGTGQLLTARIRAYNSKTNADLAGATGLLFTWFVTASYTGLNLTNFKITRDV